MATKSKFTVKHGLAVHTQSGSTATLNYPTTDGTSNQFIKTDGSGNLSFDSSVSDFLNLTDTPVNYDSAASRFLRVDSTGTAIEFSDVTMTSNVSRESFTASGNSNAITLANTYVGDNYLLVFVDGVIQFPGTNFSLDSTVLTFTATPDSAARIEIFGTSGNIISVPGDGTVSAAKLTNPLNLTNNIIKFNDVDSDVPSTNTLVFGTDNDFKIGYQGSGSGHLPNDLVIDQSDDQAIVMRRITGSNNGPDLKFFLDTPSPAASDHLGEIVWMSRNSVGGLKSYYGMRGISRSIGSGSERGALEFYGEDGTGYPSLILDDTSSSKGVRVERGTYPYNKLRLGEDVDISFEGASNNSYETTVTVEDPTQDRTITLPDSTGTVALTTVVNGYIDSGGTGLTKTGSFLNVDASQTQITAVGTIGTGTWQGTSIANGYIASSGTWNAKMDDVVEDTSPQLGGILDVNGKAISFPDADSVGGDPVDGNRLTFGADSDLKIYHDGSHSYITDAGTGELKISGSAIQLDGTFTIGADDTGYDVKFYGADAGSYMQWDESTDELVLHDTALIRYKNDSGANVLSMYHNLGNSYLANSIGSFNIFQNADDQPVSIYADDGSGGSALYFYASGSTGETKLYHYGSEKLTTKSTGVDITGALTATTKSFDIEHPTKEGMRLRYGSLEGPENGVYVRGKLQDSNIIELPDYWTGLVDENTITVSLTPIGKYNEVWVDKIEDNKVYINSSYNNIQCFYHVFGERKDVDKLQVEYE